MTDERHHHRGGPLGVVLVAGILLVAFVVGATAALTLIVRFTVFNDPCPSYDDEGPMAAPDSPYSRLMCDGAPLPAPFPAGVLPFPVVLLAAGLLGLLIALAGAVSLGGRRRRGAQSVLSRAGVLWLAAVLLAPSLLVLVSQYTLPRDCLSGRTTSGECGRDRELRQGAGTADPRGRADRASFAQGISAEVHPEESVRRPG